MPRLFPPLVAIAALIALTACQTGAPAQRAAVNPGATQPALDAACWARDAVPAAGGRTEERLFAVPCPDLLTRDFISSLQRALAVRGLHEGGVTGTMDAATRRAVRAFQVRNGLDSDILSLDGARYLGLVALPRGTF